MEKKNQSTPRKVKDPFFQVSESFFEKEEIMDIKSKYGYQGIGIYLEISLMLLKNLGKMKYDWKYISTKKTEKKIIEDIITQSGLFTLNTDGTYFSSDIVDEQLEERGKKSSDQSKRIKKRWEKDKDVSAGQRDTNISDDTDLENKPKGKILTQEEIDEIDRLDGIPPKPNR